MLSLKKVVLIAAVYAFSGLSVPGVPPPVVGVQQALAAPVAIPLPTSCILLLNMFDPQKYVRSQFFCLFSFLFFFFF